MSPPQGGSQRSLRPYQVEIHQDGGDDLAKTDDLIQKLAFASGRHTSAGESSPSRGGPSRKFRQYPQSYHDQPYEDFGASGSGSSHVPSASPDIASPYRGGDGRDAPPGYEFAVPSYQHSGAADASDATEAARRAEEEARRMAEAAREMTGILGDDNTDRGRGDGMSSYVGEGVQSCVRSMLSCLNASAEGTLLGYSSAPDASGDRFSATAAAGAEGNPYVNSTIYGGFSDDGKAPGASSSSSEKSGLLGSVMMR